MVNREAGVSDTSKHCRPKSLFYIEVELVFSLGAHALNPKDLNIMAFGGLDGVFINMMRKRDKVRYRLFLSCNSPIFELFV